MFARFSTVGGERGSADTTRDPHGFAFKFYVEEGNLDIVGNNIPVFFIRDPSKFSDFIYIQKRNPRTNLKDPNAVWDFIPLSSETIHRQIILYSNHGIPDGFRHMHGFGSHAFKLGDKKHEAAKLEGTHLDYATQDLFEAIECGDLPAWDVFIQIMEPKDAKTYSWNPFDVTKAWPHKEYPLHHVADRLLQGRLFSYPDTHRHRLGVNYKQIPVNTPRCQVNTYQHDGPMVVNGNYDSAPNYGPNSVNGHVQNNIVGSTFAAEEIEELIGRFSYDVMDDDFAQAGNLHRLMDEENKNDLCKNIAGDLVKVRKEIVDCQLPHFERADPDYRQRVKKFMKEA